MADDKAKRPEAHLQDMLDAANSIVRYVKGMNFKGFSRNEEKQAAVAMRLVIIGEAASKIDRTTQNQLPEIPFKSIRGLRNRVVHDYNSINFRYIWSIAHEQIKPMIRHLREYLKQHPP